MPETIFLRLLETEDKAAGLLELARQADSRAYGVDTAVAGFVLALTAFGVGLWLGQALDGTVLPYALGIGFWSVVTTTVAWTLVQRHTP